MPAFPFLAAALLFASSASTPPPVASAEACPADRSPIMILGTFHMANPGLDAVNIEADDVLSERRQREMADLVGRLGRFRPTKVMVEGEASNPATQERYRRYLAGTHELSRNETEQIGYRLAQAANLPAVHPIDFPMMMSGLTYDEVEFKPRRPTAGGAAREPTEEELLLRRSTLADYLARVNRPERWLPDHLGYMQLFEPDADAVAIYEKADLYTNWHKRNFRMWANVVRRTDRPADRVFLLVGAGHLAILRGLAQAMPGFCLVEPEAYLAAPLANSSQ